MKAIIVPGITDLNKGDQALVWEAHRLVKDLNLFDEIYLLEAGNTQEEISLMCSQTRERGYSLVKNILKHPRRGKHTKGEHVKDSNSSYLRLIKNGLLDFSINTIVMQIANTPLLSILSNIELFEKVKNFRDCDVIFVKGGGFIHTHGEFYSPYLIWYSLFYLRLGQSLGKKVVILPNSFGPFDGPTVKHQVIKALNNCDLIYAREQVSAQVLTNLIDKEISVKPDLGFYLQPTSDLDQVDKILSKYNLDASDQIIGITIRPWRFPGLNNGDNLYRKYIQSVADFTEYASKKGFKVVVCNQSLGPNSHEDDRNAIKDLLKLSNNLVWINENLHCDVLKALYSKFYCLLGTRFHSVIFALTSSVPCIAIGYGGNKAKGIMNDFDMQEFVVPIEDVEAKKLIEMFNSLIEKYDEISLHIANKVKTIESERHIMIEEIRVAIS